MYIFISFKKQGYERSWNDYISVEQEKKSPYDPFLCFTIYMIFYFSFSHFFIVVQVQLCPFSPHHFPHPSHPHFPPLIPPPLSETWMKDTCFTIYNFHTYIPEEIFTKLSFRIVHLNKLAQFVIVTKSQWSDKSFWIY